MAAAGKLDILIEIKSKLDELNATTAAMHQLRDETVAGVSGLKAEAQGMAAALRDAQTGGQGLASSLTSLRETTQQMASLNEEARTFSAQAKEGFGLGAGLAAFQGALDLARSLTSTLQDAATSGVKFNQTIEDSQIGIAAVLRQFDPKQFYSFDAAMAASDRAIDLLKRKALESPATFEQLVQALQAVSGAASAANIPIEKQVDLVVLMSQTLAGLGIRSEQIIQESRALLTGNITEDAAAAKILGITAEQVNQAKATGQLFEFLTSKMSAFAEAGARGSQSLTTALSNMEDALTQLEGKVAKPIFDELRKGVLELTAELSKPEIAEDMRVLGLGVAAVVKELLDLAKVAAEHPVILGAAAAAAALLTAAVAALGAAIGVIKLIEFVAGLKSTIAASLESAAAISTETTALATNTAALTTNRAARLLSAVPGGSRGFVTSVDGKLLTSAQTTVSAAELYGGGALAAGEGVAAAGASVAGVAAAAIALPLAVIAAGELAGHLLESYQHAKDLASLELSANFQKQAAALRAGVAGATDMEKLVHAQLDIQNAIAAKAEEIGKLHGHDREIAEQQLFILNQMLSTSARLAGDNTASLRRQLESAQNEQQHTLAQVALMDSIKAKQDELNRVHGETAEKLRAQIAAQQAILTGSGDLATAQGVVNNRLAQGVALTQQMAQAIAGLSAQLANLSFERLGAPLQLDTLKGRAGAAQANFAALYEKSAGQAPDGGLSLSADQMDAALEKLGNRQDEAALKLRQYAVEYGTLTKQIDTVQKTVDQRVEKITSVEQARLAHAKEMEALDARAAGNKDRADALDDEVKTLKLTTQLKGQLKISDSEAAADARRQVEDERRIKEAKEGVAAATKAGHAADRSAAAAAKQERAEEKFEDEQRQQRVNDLRERISEIQNDPTITMEEKERRLLPLLAQERAALQENIAYWQAYNDANRGSTDSAVLSRIQQNDRRINEAQRQQTGLNKQVGINDFGGQFNSAYVRQVDQLGTAAQNAGKAFDTSLNTAIQGTSQALDAVIFKTGDWKQAMGSAVRSGVQGLIELGVKTLSHYALLGAQMIAHKILGTTLKQQDTAETIANNTAKQASLTTTSLLESITSYGVAAAVGAAALLAAFALVGGFESGGHTGGREGEFAGFVHGEEFVVNAGGVRAAPPGLLEAINNQQVRVAGGGASSSGSVAAFSAAAARDRQSAAASAQSKAPNVKVVQVTNETDARRELLNSSDFDHAFIQRMDRHGVVRRRT